MNKRLSIEGVGAVLAALILAEACTQSRSPNLPPNTDAANADLPSADVARVDTVSGTGACLDPRQLDAGQPATFEATGCQHTMAGGRMLAVFTWTNRTGQAQTAPYGPANHVSPGSDAQGQSPWFPIGGSSRFAVPFDGSLATWFVFGQSVTVSQASPDCGSACSYFQLAGPDAFLVDTCTHACGDGVCDDVEARPPDITTPVNVRFRARRALDLARPQDEAEADGSAWRARSRAPGDGFVPGQIQVWPATA